MLDFLVDNASDILLGLLMIFLRLFGQKKSAEEIELKLKKKRMKKKKKLLKKVKKYSSKVNEDLQELEEIEKEGE